MLLVVSQWNGSVDKGACSQVWVPEFNSWDPYDGRRELMSKSSAELLSWPVAHMYLHDSTNKIVKEIKTVLFLMSDYTCVFLCVCSMHIKQYYANVYLWTWLKLCICIFEIPMKSRKNSVKLNSVKLNKYKKSSINIASGFS